MSDEVPCYRCGGDITHDLLSATWTLENTYRYEQHAICQYCVTDIRDQLEHPGESSRHGNARS